MNNIANHTQVLKKKIAGDVLLPGDSGYEKSATIFTATGRPAVVVRPASAADVAAAVAFAQEHKLTLSVRCGGHSVAGHSTNDDGMVIDVTRLNTIQVIDQAKHIVRVGAGAIWIDVANQLNKHGLAISSGDTTTVGVGGLVLAGGVGWLVRKYGLTLDHVVAAEIVTADGQIIRTDKTSHPDLFWAVRGGGGNFGVAISFDIVAMPLKDVYGGMVMYDMKDLVPALRGWRDCMRTAPEELNTMFLVMPANPAFADMPSGVMILVCYGGDDEQKAMAAIDPLLKLGTLVNKDITRKPYSEVLGDAHSPGDIKIITNNTFVHELTDELIDTIQKNSNVIMQIRSVGGAMNRVKADETAFAHRDSEALIVSPAFVPKDASPEIIQATLKPWRDIERFGDGAYISFFSQDSSHELAAGYPPATLNRLASIKQRYDPENIFSQNFNIKPAGKD